MSLLKNLVPPNYEFGIGQCTFYPGPLKCFGAPRHQILAKIAPQKTHNRAKLNSRQECVNQVNPKNLKGHI